MTAQQSSSPTLLLRRRRSTASLVVFSFCVLVASSSSPFGVAGFQQRQCRQRALIAGCDRRIVSAGPGAHVAGRQPREVLLVPPPTAASWTTVVLATSAGSDGSGEAVEVERESEQQSSASFDYDAVAKYAAAIGTQMGLLFAFFTGLDRLVAAAKVKQVPFFVNFVLFYLLALKSRVFNPLSNTRPQPRTMEIGKDGNGKEEVAKRNMPTWTPPGFVFPIVWLLIIGPIRAAASALLYQSTSSYANVAIMSLMLHLSVGDVWNTINNVERRYGASVVGVGLVWLTKAYAAYRYYQVVPLAGQLLAAPLIWLTVAAALVGRTWRLNPDPESGKPEPLYPVAGTGKRTKFAWFSSSK